MSSARVRTFFTYVDESYLLTRAHPVVKVLSLVAVNLVAWIVEAPVPLTLLLFSLLVAAILLRAPLGRLKSYAPYLLLVAQAVVLSYVLGSRIPGNVTYVNFPWGSYVTDRTLLYMLSVMLRITCMLVGSTLVFLSLRDVDIIYGLKGLGIPFTAAFSLNLALRFSSLFLEDYARVRDAMLLKGVKLDAGSPLERARLLSRTAVPLMVIAIRRMQDLTFILELKGFPPSGRRTYIYTFKWGPVEAIASAALVAATLAVIFAKVFSPLLSFPGWPFA